MRGELEAEVIKRIRPPQCIPLTKMHIAQREGITKIQATITSVILSFFCEQDI